MIVLDASAVIDWLLQTPEGRRIEERIYAHNESLHAPHLVDLEVAQVLRRMVRDGTIPVLRAEKAICDLRDLRMTRYPHSLFLSQIWQRRNNMSAYDASYVVLAEKLGATLLTRDRGLASVSGPGVSVELM